MGLMGFIKLTPDLKITMLHWEFDKKTLKSDKQVQTDRCRFKREVRTEVDEEQIQQTDIYKFNKGRRRADIVTPPFLTDRSGFRYGVIENDSKRDVFIKWVIIH